MTLPPVIHAEPTTPRREYGIWRAEPTAESTPYVPAAAMAEAEARIKELEAAIKASTCQR